jgi:glutathione peroxidase
MNDFYTLTATLSNGTPLPFIDLKNKAVLVVNTATKCHFTTQFTGLEKIHQTYGSQGLSVIGFPCNQFGSQEPLSNETMQESCQLNYGVSFALTKKADVNGANTHPVFQYLKKQRPGFWGSRIKWNFTKFLIDTQGQVIKRYGPTTSPASIEKDIRKLLALSA